MKRLHEEKDSRKRAHRADFRRALQGDQGWAMTARLFANEEVIILASGGEFMRVATDQLATATLIQAASELLAVAADRMRRSAAGKGS